MWKDIGIPWQTAFEEAWEAYKSGGVPIGAALYDENGVLLIRDHNRSGEKETVNRLMSHAEANVLRRLDTASGLALNSLVLYTTMEPCPMCMGTCVMSGIRHLRFAARDPYCGFTYLANEAPYFRQKNLDFTHEGGETELVQITVQSHFELERMARGGNNRVLEEFREMLPEAVTTAEKLFADGLLKGWSAENREAGAVFEDICALSREIMS